MFTFTVAYSRTDFQRTQRLKLNKRFGTRSEVYIPARGFAYGSGLTKLAISQWQMQLMLNTSLMVLAYTTVRYQPKFDYISLVIRLERRPRRSILLQ
jgi:hypothetical protein